MLQLDNYAHDEVVLITTSADGRWVFNGVKVKQTKKKEQLKTLSLHSFLILPRKVLYMVAMAWYHRH